MKKNSLIKITSYITLGVVAVAGASVLGLTLLTNPDNYKPKIIKAVADATGRNLTIGEMKWTFLPDFGIQLDKLSLSNPKGQVGNFAEINSLRISLEPLPLIHGDVTIDHLLLNGLNLRLITDGKTDNWTFSGEKLPANKLQIQLSLLELENSSFSYENTKVHSEKKLSNFSLVVKKDKNGIINYSTDKLTLKNIQFNLNHTLKGSGNVIAKINPLNYSGNLTIPTFSLNEYLNQIGVERPKLNNPQLLDKVALSSNFAGSANTLSLSEINAKINDSTIQGLLEIQSISAMSGHEDINIDKLELSDYKELNGYKLPMKNIVVQGNFNNSKEKLNALQDLTVQNMVLHGFNFNNLTARLDKITDMGGVKVLDVPHATEVFNGVQTQIKQLSLPGRKDLSQKTDLGSLKAHIVVHNNILTTPIAQIAGPSMISSGNGTINLTEKTISYTVQTRLLHKNSLLSTLIIPYHISGKLSDPHSTLDWASVNQQIIKYYTTGGGVGNAVVNGTKKAVKATGSFFKSMF